MWWNVFGPGGGGRSLATFAKHNFLEMDIEFYPLGKLVEIVLHFVWNEYMLLTN